MGPRLPTWTHPGLNTYFGATLPNVIFNASMDSCLFSGNTGSYGGAVRADSLSQVIVTNSTFSGNMAKSPASYSTAEGMPSDVNVSCFKARSDYIHPIQSKMELNKHHLTEGCHLFCHILPQPFSTAGNGGALVALDVDIVDLIGTSFNFNTAQVSVRDV